MEVYRVQNMAVMVTAIILAMGTLLEAIRCYSCRGMGDNEDCNGHVTECTRDIHDTCYTKIRETEGVGRVFDKGCSDWAECVATDSHQEGNTCNSFEGECIYCCSSDSNCNEGATSNSITPISSTIMYMISLALSPFLISLYS